MKVIVKDVNGSWKKWPTPSCKCDSWIDHWDYNNNNSRPIKCPVCGKQDNNLVGGHVQISKIQNSEGQFIDSTDETFYILPICNSCNVKGDFTAIVNSSYLVKARKEDCMRE